MLLQKLCVPVFRKTLYEEEFTVLSRTFNVSSVTLVVAG
jgi:hypothetical protein